MGRRRTRPWCSPRVPARSWALRVVAGERPASRRQRGDALERYVALCLYVSGQLLMLCVGSVRAPRARSAVTMSTPVLRCELYDVPSMDQHEQPSSAAHQHTLSNPGGLCFMFSRKPSLFPLPSDGRPLCVAHHARREMFGPSPAGGAHVSRPGRPLRSAPHRCIFEMLTVSGISGVLRLPSDASMCV